MLVLRRKVGESIVLAGTITIMVCAVEGDRVKIGITAPDDVTIVREELLKIAQDCPSPPSPTNGPPTTPHGQKTHTVDNTKGSHSHGR